MEKHPEISLEELADYAFEELSPEREAELEAFFDTNEDYAQIVDALLDYCLAHQLSSRKELMKHLEQQRNAFIEEVGYPLAEQPSRPSGYIPAWKIGAGIAALIAMIVVGYWILSSPDTEKEWDTEEIIQASVQKHSPFLNAAGPGGRDWEGLLLNGRYADALKALQSQTAGQVPAEVYDKRAFFIGVLLLYLDYDQPGSIKEAIQYLEVGRSFDSTAAQYHLLNAYILNRQTEEASQILDQSSWSLDQLPEYVQEAYQENN